MVIAGATPGRQVGYFEILLPGTLLLALGGREEEVNEYVAGEGESQMYAPVVRDWFIFQLRTAIITFSMHKSFFLIMTPADTSKGR